MEPPLAPRPFRFGALSFGVSFSLIFGGIWALTSGILIVVFLAGAPEKVQQMIWLPMLFGFAGSGIFLFGLIGFLSQYKLYTRGRAAEANVVTVRLTNKRINRVRVREITYSFESLTGATRSEGALTREVAVGERLWIIYDAETPTRSIVW